MHVTLIQCLRTNVRDASGGKLCKKQINTSQEKLFRTHGDNPPTSLYMHETKGLYYHRTRGPAAALATARLSDSSTSKYTHSVVCVVVVEC